MNATVPMSVREEEAVGVIVRPLRPEDREPIRRLLVETGVFTDKEIDIALELIDVALGQLDQQDYIIHVCDDGEKVLGYYCIGPTPATIGTFDLYWIAVHPAFHGKGIGRMLDDHAVNLVRGRGGRLVIAETSSLPRYGKTREFYLRRGYLEVSHIRDYYKPGDDLVVYCKYLTQQHGGAQ